MLTSKTLSSNIFTLGDVDRMFDLRTRLNRKGFLLHAIALFVFITAFAVALHPWFLSEHAWQPTLLLCIGMYAIMLFALVRRLHDIGRTGWIALPFFLTPPTAILLLLLLVFVPSERRANKYGPVPS